MRKAARLVLVSEDSGLIALRYEQTLHEAGFRVDLAASPAEALRAIAIEQPAVAIVDLTLRDSLDAAELARTLVARGVPVIVATGYGGAAADALVRRLGASVRLGNPSARRCSLRPSGASWARPRADRLARRWRGGRLILSRAPHGHATLLVLRARPPHDAL